MRTPSLYDTDFAQWAEQQAQYLKDGKYEYLDKENLIEEIEDLGRQERNRLESNLEILLMHLLKWEYEPTHRSSSWRSTIREHRKRVALQLRKMPSLKSYLLEAINDACDIAITRASGETGLPEDTFPPLCPFTPEQVLDSNFFGNA